MKQNRRHERNTTSNIEQQNQEAENKRINEIEAFADLLTTTSPEDICCEKHEVSKRQENCEQCKSLIEKVNKYQNHRHTFMCAKKK